MRWNKQSKAERPKYPKLVPIAGTKEEVRDLLPALLRADPEAEIVEGGGRGLYARVHNEDAETAAKGFSESRSFPLSRASCLIEVPGPALLQQPWWPR